MIREIIQKKCINDELKKKIISLFFSGEKQSVVRGSVYNNYKTNGNITNRRRSA